MDAQIVQFLVNNPKRQGGRRFVSGELVKVNTRTAWVRWDGRVIQRRIARDMPGFVAVAAEAQT